jgi:hypothetical protein
MNKKILNERLGVPEGIIDVSKNLYNDIIDIFFKKLSKYKRTYNFTIKPKLPYQIKDFTIDKVELEITLHETDQTDVVDFIGMSVKSNFSKDFSGEKPKFINDIKSTSKIEFDLVVPEVWDVNMVKEYLQNKKVKIISSFAHELKHEYDDFKSKTFSLVERINYNVARKMMGWLKPLNDFSYYLYFISKIESLVRTTEISTELDLMGVTKKQFLNFLLKNRTYKLLKDIQNFSFGNLKNNLLEYIKEIEKIFDEIEIDYSDMSDSEKVDEILRLYVVNFSNKKFKDYLRYMTDSFMDDILGFSEKKENWIEKYKRTISKYENNEIKFFENSEKLFKFVSTKMIKKISKLYDMLSEKTVSESIHNPELYSIINKNNERIIKDLKEIVKKEKSSKTQKNKPQ